MAIFGKKHTADQEEDEYYVVPMIPVDETIHSADHPFCDDMTCPCHEDSDAVGELNGYHQDGLVSTNDADRIYRGKTLY